ncbi:MAG: hypothetical protein ABJB05_11320 [Parafilimonas sp.]
MKVQELRIDNFFDVRAYYDDTGRIKRITEIGKNQVHIAGKWISVDKLVSISITEEILLNSGFTQFSWLKESSVFECSFFKCLLNDSGVNFFCDNFKNIKPVKYLHQLQNLYFDLTGEELETNFNTITYNQKERA